MGSGLVGGVIDKVCTGLTFGVCAGVCCGYLLEFFGRLFALGHAACEEARARVSRCCFCSVGNT